MNSSITKDHLVALALLRADNDGVVDSARAEELGVTRQVLSALCQEGKLVRVGRGQYVIPKDSQDPLESLAHGEQFIFSHQTALNLDGLLPEPPDLPHVTYPEGVAPDPVLRGRCHVHHTKPQFLTLGLLLVETPYGNLVPAYDTERSLCDVAKARGAVGSGVFLGAITRYASNYQHNLPKLYDYGDKMGVSHVLSSYLKVLLPNEHLPGKD